MARIRSALSSVIVTLCLLNFLQPTVSADKATVSVLIEDFVKDVAPNKAVDLVLIVDRSTGMGIERFIIEISKVTGAILKQYTVIHPDFTRPAVITFGGDSRVIFDYISNEPTTKCGVFGGGSPTPWEQVRYISNDTYAKGTNLRAAFTDAKNIFGKGKAKRASVKQIVLLVTDGDYSDKDDPIEQVNIIKDSGVTIYALGIGNWLKPGNVRILASQEGYYGSQEQWTEILRTKTPTSYSKDTPPLWVDDVPKVCTSSCGAHARCQCDVLRGVSQCMCHKGYYMDGGKCTACPLNTYKSNVGNQACQQCPHLKETTGTGSEKLEQCKCPEKVTCTDPCESNPCVGDNEVCRRDGASYKCECLKGWSSENCSKNADDCLNNACQNGATCVDMLGDYTCVCAWGFYGRYCEFNVNECTQDDVLCRNGATCIDGSNNFNCRCTKGWVGRFCQDVDPNEEITAGPPKPVTDAPEPTKPVTIKSKTTVATTAITSSKSTKPTTTTEAGSSSNVTGLLVGVFVGGFLAGIACGMVCCLIKKSRKSTTQDDAKNTPDTRSQDQADANRTSQTSQAYAQLTGVQPTNAYTGLQLSNPDVGADVDRPDETPNAYARVQLNNTGGDTNGQRQLGEEGNYLSLQSNGQNVNAEYANDSPYEIIHNG